MMKFVVVGEMDVEDEGRYTNREFEHDNISLTNGIQKI
jgi:hypothetical protein